MYPNAIDPSLSDLFIFSCPLFYYCGFCNLMFLIHYVEFEEKLQYFCKKVVISQKYFSQKVIVCLSV